MWGSGAARAGWYTPVHNIFQLNFVNLICQFDYRSELCVSYFLSILSYFLSRETLTQRELGNFAKFEFLNYKIDQFCQIHYGPNAMNLVPNLSHVGCWDVNNPRGLIMQMHMLCLINQLVKINVFPNFFYEDVSKTAFLRFCNIISKIILFKKC